jgi:hypothetical protein
MSILVIGQSHVAAIRAAARIRREADPERPRTRVIHTLEARYAPEITGEGRAEDEEGVRLSPPLAAEIAAQIDRHHPFVASCIGGNAHNVLALLRHPRPFDFRFPDEPSIEPGDGAEPMPLALVRAALEAAMARDLLRLRMVAAAAGPLVHLESPPPLADPELIAACAEGYFLERGITAAAVAPAPLRHRMWRLHGTIMREACAILSVPFVPVPAEALDEAGFLRPELAGDATHGNAMYGELLIRHLERTAALGA